MYTAGILVYPQVEELDFIGPYEVLSYINKLNPRSIQVLLVSPINTIVQAYNGLKFIPDCSFTTCPQLDILVVPGGKGRITAMHDSYILDFIRMQSHRCMLVTSVCTGAFLLAEAGLLKGKQVTTYHTAFNELRKYTVNVIEGIKVIRDGNIMTAAGVSSGLELGFYILSHLFGAEKANEVAKCIEYKIDIK